MIKRFTKPGFESVFYFGLLLLIVLPALVFAQQPKPRTTVIEVKSSDTLVNGIPKLSKATERNQPISAVTVLNDSVYKSRPQLTNTIMARQLVMPQLDSSSKFFDFGDTTGKPRPRFRVYALPHNAVRSANTTDTVNGSQPKKRNKA